MREVMKRLLLVVLLVCVAFTAVNAAEPGGDPDVDGAGICYYDGLKYSQGACHKGQRCQADGTWAYDWTCPQP